MKKNIIFASLTALFALGGLVSFLLSKQKANQPAIHPPIVNPQHPVLVRSQEGDSAWLCLPRSTARLLTLKTGKNALLDGTTGEVWVAFKTDTISGIKVPSEEHRWKRRLAHLLADPIQVDSMVQWQEAQAKLLHFTADERDSLDTKNISADGLLFHRFLTRITSLQNRQRTTYLLDRQLYSDQVATVSMENKAKLQLGIGPIGVASFPGWLDGAVGCWLLAAALGVAGWLRREDNSEKIDNEEFSPPIAESETPVPYPARVTISNEVAEPVNSSLPVPNVELALIQLYARQFYKRYGTLFEELQQESLPLAIGTRERVLQQLIEMALHAHTFAYFGIMDKLGALDQSPNARLLLENRKLEAQPDPPIRVFSPRPYETDAKYRALYDLVKDLPLRELDVLLEDQVYIPPDFFALKKA
ncbi:MAG: hypothetical protein KKG00_15520 [Bacteroidetes bacterium]|nr:hypothetical protein [Bacteroidota bacterium]